MLRKILTAAFIGVATLGFSQAKTQKIKSLLEMTGSGKVAVQLTNQMLAGFKQSYPTVPESFWNEVSKEVKASDFVAMVVPIYDKHFTEAEIDDLTVFFKTPTGQKFIQEQSAIVTESMNAGRVWGEAVARRVMEKMDAADKK